MKKTNSYMFYY